jgi:hypothetical protein
VFGAGGRITPNKLAERLSRFFASRPAFPYKSAVGFYNKKLLKALSIALLMKAYVVYLLLIRFSAIYIWHRIRPLAVALWQPCGPDLLRASVTSSHGSSDVWPLCLIAADQRFLLEVTP